jgi:dolichyl-phosphate-mannose-protein mannosyltransferase
VINYYFTEVAYGANVTIRNFGHGGGLLHSHPSVYPEGSKQQQITCYGHKDSNNQWRILKPRELKQDGTYGSYDIDKENAHIIHDGDFIRLFHINTKRNLHTHPISAPLNVKQWEVSGYGNLTMGDDQDNWRVEIVSDVQKNENKELRALTTRFRLFNIQMNCYLASHKTPLPQWGFKQNEVYCDRQVDTTSQNTWWNVEDNAHKLCK